MVCCKKYFLTIILVSSFPSTLVAACGSDDEGNSQYGGYNEDPEDIDTTNLCFDEMKMLTKSDNPQVKDMGKVAIRDWMFSNQQIMSNDMRSYYREMERNLDFDAVQSPSEWCSENARRLVEAIFVEGDILEQESTSRHLSEEEECQLIDFRMRKEMANEDPIKSCRNMVQLEFGKSKKDALLFAFNDRTLAHYESTYKWTINFRYGFMEYLMNAVEFTSDVSSPKDFCFRDIYYDMSPNDKRKQKYMDRRKKKSKLV